MDNHTSGRRIKDTRTRRRLEREAKLANQKPEIIEPELSEFEKNLTSIIDDFMDQLEEEEELSPENQEKETLEEPAEEIQEEINSDAPSETMQSQTEVQSDAETVAMNDDSSMENGEQKAPETVLDEGKRNARILIIAICLCLFALMFITVARMIERSRKDEAAPAADVQEEIQVEPAGMPPVLKNMWLSNKAINRDYIGQIIFDSGLIDLPIVQATDVYDKDGNLYTFYSEEGDLVEDPENYTGNDVYIWTNWKNGEYDPYGDGGSVFLDFRDSLKDQNLIIYGHHFARDFDPSGSKLFTPLDLLLKQENYKANNTLKLVLNNEIREYVISNVFMMDTGNEYVVNVLRRNMNEDYSGNPTPGFYKEFISYIDSVSEYNTGEKLTENDNVLTLVTCIQHQPELRQVIVAKETGKTVYE